MRRFPPRPHFCSFPPAPGHRTNTRSPILPALTILGGTLAILGLSAIEQRRDLSPVRVNSIGMNTLYVAAGTFHMGSPPGESGRLLNEGPARRVTLTRPFYLASTGTTIEQFRTFVEETGYVTAAERDASGGFGIDFDTGQVVQRSGIHWRAPGFPGLRQSGRHPVVLISWSDAEAFCVWLSAKEGRSYRLPTEAEWEYAARGASAGPYWFGGEVSSLAANANVADQSLQKGHGSSHLNHKFAVAATLWFPHCVH